MDLVSEAVTEAVTAAVTEAVTEAVQKSKSDALSKCSCKVVTEREKFKAVSNLVWVCWKAVI